jgi:hypothetical protein
MVKDSVLSYKYNKIKKALLIDTLWPFGITTAEILPGLLE